MSKFGKRCHSVGDLVEDRRINLLFLVVGVPVRENSFRAEIIDLDAAVAHRARVPVAVQQNDVKLA